MIIQELSIILASGLLQPACDAVAQLRFAGLKLHKPLQETQRCVPASPRRAGGHPCVAQSLTVQFAPFDRPSVCLQLLPRARSGGRISAAVSSLRPHGQLSQAQCGEVELSLEQLQGSLPLTRLAAGCHHCT